MIEKQCEMCGRRMTVPDNRYKFCEPCKKARKKMFDYNAVRAFRERAKEQREQIKQQNLELIQQNELLRQQVRELQYRVEALDAVCRKAVQNGKE